MEVKIYFALVKRSDGEIEGGGVQSIEAASARLARHDWSELGRRFEALCHQRADEPIEREAKARRFDAFGDVAAVARRAATLIMCLFHWFQ